MTATSSKRIPKFKSYREEAAFWDTHSLVDYWKPLKPATLVYDPKREQGITVRFDRETLGTLK